MMMGCFDNNYGKHTKLFIITFFLTILLLINSCFVHIVDAVSPLDANSATEPDITISNNLQTYDGGDVVIREFQPISGGYVIFTSTEYNPNFSDTSRTPVSRIITLDYDGNIIMNRTLAEYSEKFGCITAGTATSDSGFITAMGLSSTFNFKNLVSFDSNMVTLTKFNNAKEIVWETSYRPSYSEINNAEFVCIKKVRQAYDGGFFLLGVIGFTNKNDNGVSYREYAGYWAKVDKNGDKVSEHFSERRIPDSTAFNKYCLANTSDGGFIFTNGDKDLDTSNPRTNTAVEVIKTDINGNPIWTTYLPLKRESEEGAMWGVTDIRQTSDQGFIVIGNGALTKQLPDFPYHHVEPRHYIIKLSAQGGRLWGKSYSLNNKQYPDRFYSHYMTSVTQTNDGGYIAAGSRSYDQEKGTIVMKYNASGDPLWKKELSGGYWGGISHYTHGQDILKGSDGGYVLARIFDGYMGPTVVFAKLAQDSVFKIRASSVRSQENDTFKVTATAECLSYGRLDNTNTAKANWQLLDADGNKLEFSGFLNYNSSLNRWESESIPASLEGQPSQVLVSFEDIYGNYGSWKQKVVSAKLGVSHFKYIPGSEITIFAPVWTIDNKPYTDADINVTYIEDGSSEHQVLNDSGINGDMCPRDGVYSAKIKPDGGSKKYILYIDDVKCGEVQIEPIRNPTLYLLTDYKALHDEYIDIGFDIAEDEDNNGINDFYDAMTRIAYYTASHNGTTVDLRDEITVEKGSLKDYSSLNYSKQSDRIEMGRLIDSCIHKLSRSGAFKYIAIVGNDQVVPFYRRQDPMNRQVQYYNSFTQQADNATIYDCNGYIMTDIPYSTYENTDPNLVHRPKPDVGIGRIFSEKPLQLVKMIDGYEKPLDVRSKGRKASLFCLKNENFFTGINWDYWVGKSVLNTLNMNFSKGDATGVPPYQPERYYFFNGNNMEWFPEDVTKAVANTNISLIWSHAAHDREKSSGNWILRNTFENTGDIPGHLIINQGCHSGLSLANHPDGSYNNLFHNSLVNSTIKNQTAYIAPTTFGMGSNAFGPAYHQVLFRELFSEIFSQFNLTIGDIQSKAYGKYWSEVSPDNNDRFYTYAAYGTAFYGLPTQPLNSSSGPDLRIASFKSNETEKADQEVSAFFFTNSEYQYTNTKALEEKQIDFTIDIPNYRVIDNDGGEVYIDLPFESSAAINANLPPLPKITRQYLLPKNASITLVELIESIANPIPGNYNWSNAYPVSLAQGKIYGYVPFPETYPEKSFWWSCDDFDEGKYLKISAVPLSFINYGQSAEFYQKMVVRVRYTVPLSPVTIQQVVVDNDNRINAGVDNVPVRIMVSSTSQTQAKLVAHLQDDQGVEIGVIEQDILLTTGENTVKVNIPSISLKNGPKEAIVYLYMDDGTQMNVQAFVTEGISIEASLQRNIIPLSEGYGVITAKIWDELGYLISGLDTESFTAEIDGAQCTDLIINEDSDGYYTIRFNIEGLKEGLNKIVISANDARGHKSIAQFDFTSVLTVPLSGIKQISAGSDHMLALSDDGYVWSWGSNQNGELGVGNSEQYSNVAVRILSLENITQVEAGNSVSFAVTEDGMVWGWGSNSYYQLGSINCLSKSEPVLVPGLSNVKQLSAGSYNYAALLDNGSVIHWGAYQGYWEVVVSEPKKVLNLGDVKMIKAGDGYCVALKNDGTLWYWGFNKPKITGRSDFYFSIPIQIADIGDVNIMDTHSEHILALKKDGTLWAWGDNDSGQCIPSEESSINTPTQVTVIPERIISVSAGREISSAVTEGGNLYIWGTNMYGSLGIGKIGNVEKKIYKVEKLSNIKSSSLSTVFASALDNEGAVYTWGENSSGQLGICSDITSSIPASVVYISKTTYGGEKLKGLLEVSVLGDGNVRINTEIENLPPNYKYSYKYGTNIKLTAVANSKSQFAYWEDGITGSIISTNPVYETIMGTGKNVKAVFYRIPKETTDEFTIVFINRSGKILQSTNVSKNASAVPPADPTLVGYRFVRWNMDFSNVVSDMIISPVFERLPDRYNITVINGQLSTGHSTGQYQFDMPVRVIANTPPAGMNFSHWEQDGMKISNNTNHSFFMPKRNTVLTAVYVQETEEINRKPFITLSEDVYIDSAGKSILFTATRNVTGEYLLLESGVILLKSNTEFQGALTLDTDNINLGKINNNSTDQFYVRKINVAEGDIWYARAYLIYEDTKGNIITVYSEITARGEM